MSAQTRPLDGAASHALRLWLPALGAIAIACVVFGLAFRREIDGALRVWVGSTAYNHCFLVLPLVALLLWNRREIVAGLRPSTAPWALALVLGLSAVWVVAALLDILEAEQLVVVAIFEAVLLAVLGWRVFRALLAPLLFLFFLVPFGAFLVPALQRITAAFAVTGLRLLDIPVFVDGLIIQIPAGYFEVAEACAGLRFLIASLVFGCFYATIIYRSWARRVAFIALSVALPIVANGLRAFGLVLLGHVHGNAAAALADHVIYGWVFFTLVTVLLIAIGMLFAESPGPTAPPPVVARQPASPKLRLATTMSVGLLIVALGPGYLMVIESAAAAPAAARGTPALQAGGAWVRDPDAGADWGPIAAGVSRQSTEVYRRGDAKVTQFLASYPLPARGSPLTRSGDGIAEAKDWKIAGTGHVSALLGSTPITVNTVIITRDGRRRLVWWFYVIDGKVTSSKLEARLLQARATLRGGRHLAALAAVSTEADGASIDNATLADFVKFMLL